MAKAREVASPLSEADLLPPEPGLDRITFCTPLQDRELLRLAAFLREYPSLEHIARLTAIERLSVERPSTKLGRMRSLESLELAMVRGLHDMSALAGLQSLERLTLRVLKHVTTLPSLSALHRLRDVYLDHTFHAIDMRGVPPEAFASLAGHRAMRKVWIGLGSDGANAKIRSMFSYLGGRFPR